LFKFRTLCVFEPPFGGLGTTYDVHLGLIGKRVVDFLLMLIYELFSLGFTAGSIRANLYIKIGRFVCPTGSLWECRTAGMPIMSHCQPYATMQHCGHAAYFDRRHLARSALRPCPTACMRECLHRCVRWEDEEVVAGCSVQLIGRCLR